MNNYMDIVLLVIMVPTLLVMFFYEYPSKWKDRKFIFGVRNRGEFKEQDASSEIDKITAKTRKQALIVMICEFVVMGLIMLMPSPMMRMAFWMVFVLAALTISSIPFMRANREMKSLKRAIGIRSGAGTKYADLKSAGSVRALRLTKILIPVIISAVLFVAALICDLGVVDISGIAPSPEMSGSFMMTSMTGSFLFIGIILIPIALLMDGIRNEVISGNSDTNMNYNRARKKIFADWFVLMAWINTAYIAVSVPLMIFFYGDIIMIVLLAAYLLMLMVSVILIVRNILAVDKRYRKETTIEEDDDDKWIFGSFYYNPDDKRLNVAKRMGVGGTINIAHPAGKAIMIISGLLIIGVMVMAVFFAAFGNSSASVRIENDTLICTMLTDCYKIPVSDIKDAEIVNDTGSLVLVKQSGMNMPEFNYGTYIVNGERNCRVFLNMESSDYITFEAEGVKYYINADTVEETAGIFEKLAS